MPIISSHYHLYWSQSLQKVVLVSTYLKGKVVNGRIQYEGNDGGGLGLFFDKYWIVLNSDWVQFEGLGQAAKLHLSRREGGLPLFAHLGACTLPKGGGGSQPLRPGPKANVKILTLFSSEFFFVSNLFQNTYGSVSAGREKWPFNVLFF